jgi:hypothetical protein
LANFSQNQFFTLQGVKPLDKTNTQSIIPLVNTDNTETDNNKKIKTVNMTSYHTEYIRTEWIPWLLMQKQLLLSQTIADTKGGQVSMQMGTKVLAL